MARSRSKSFVLKSAGDQRKWRIQGRKANFAVAVVCLFDDCGILQDIDMKF